AITLPDCAAVMPKTSTFSAMSTYVTIGEGRSERTGAPAIVRACGVDRSAAATQLTQCCPTEAGRRHSGHAGRPQREQASRVGRSGWRTHRGWGCGPPPSAAEPQPGFVMGTLSGDGDAVDHDVVDRAIAAVGGGGRDRVDDLLGLGVDDLTEDGVATVEVWGRADGDEELRAVGARAGVRHREQVAAVELQLGVELVGELVARAAAAGAGGVATLDHEAVDDAVEDRAVVERTAGLALGVLGLVLLGALSQADEVLDRL